MKRQVGARVVLAADASGLLVTPPVDVAIRTPSSEKAQAISALALRSKAHWGYDATFLEACRTELTYSADDCVSGDLFVAEVARDLAGMGVVHGRGPVGELAALFVDPLWMGRGIGAALLSHALELAQNRGISKLFLDADPHAETFYAHHGARTIGETPSGSIPGRRLPRMELQVPSV